VGPLCGLRRPLRRCGGTAACPRRRRSLQPRPRARAGIIAGLAAYIAINTANWLLDKVGECFQWSIAGSDLELPQPDQRSFSSRRPSGLVRCSLHPTTATVKSLLANLRWEL